MQPLNSWNINRCLRCASILVLGAASQAFCDAPPLPRFELVRAAYVQSVTSIGSCETEMQVKWSTTSRATTTAETLTDFRIRVLRSGDRELKEVRARNSAGTSENTMITSFDGRQYYEFSGISETKEGLPFLPSGKIGKARSKTTNGYPTSFTFLGDEILGFLNLRDLLRSSAVAVVGWSTVENAQCVEVHVGPVEAGSTKHPRPVILKIWFDPAKGYLPAQIQQRSPEAINDSVASGFWDYTVLEFGEIQAVTGAKAWIPIRGIAKGSKSQYELLATRHIPRSNITTSSFQPEFPPGTKLDITGSDGKIKQSVIGGKDARQSLYSSNERYRAAHNQIAAKVQTSIKTQNAPSARTADAWGSTLPYWSIAVSIGLVALAVVIWFVRRA